MPKQPLRLRALAFAAGVAVLATSGVADADPPSRIARVGYMSGAVSFSPAGESDWVRAAINRPLTTGDRLWADAGARAEIQIGGAMIRMDAGTGVSILNLDDRIAQMQLSQGTLNVRVRRLEPDQVVEVDTPNLAFSLRQPGEYRIDVDPDGNATTIVMHRGQGDAYGEGAAYVIDSSQPYRFTGTDLREYEYVDAPRADEFDRWSSDRDRSYDNSRSARYVSQDVVGYQDLDANGTWRVDVNYGNVWTPNHVAAGWAPYRDGHWAWVDPWGWTWVDDAPWGFAVSHYGRWANLGGTWGWVPGPVRSRAYYAPALVAFVGIGNLQVSVSSGGAGEIAWFPLGPRDVYRPSYVVSRGYFENVNRSNTVINTTVINNYYSNTNVTNVVYANRDIPGAVIAVPRSAFVQSQPVSVAAVRVSREAIAGGPVAFIAPVAPTLQSVHGAAVQGDKPPARLFERPVVARTAPPAARSGFAAQQQQLATTPGKPLAAAARTELKPAAAAPVPAVKVIAPAQAVQPTVRPPPAAADARAGRGKPETGKTPPAAAISGAPVAPAPGNAPAAAPARAAAPSPGAAQTQVPPPAQAAHPVPPAGAPERSVKHESAGTPETRGKPETSGRPDQGASGVPRAQTPSMLPPQRPQDAGGPKVVTPQATPPAAATPRSPAPAQPQPQAQPPARPDMAPTPQTARPMPPARPMEPGPGAAPPASTPPLVQPRAQPQPQPQPQPAPKAEPRGNGEKPAAGKPNDKKKDPEEQKREEDNAKQKG